MPITELDLSDARQKITLFIKRKVSESQTDGAIVGVSGGIDSAVTSCLCVEALGSRRVFGLIMPDLRVTPEEDISDARMVVEEIGIQSKLIDIAPIHRAFLKGLQPNNFGEGNLRARIRMALLYYHANMTNRLVAGTGDRSELLLGYFCYDWQTRVMTTEGPKYYWELSPGSIVFSLKPETRKLVEIPVESVHTFDYEGDMVEIQSRHLDLLVTPNHRMLISRNNGTGPLGFERADSLLGVSQVCVPVPEPWDGVHALPKTVDFGNYLESPIAEDANESAKMSSLDFLYLLGLFIGDGHLASSEVAEAAFESDLTHSEYIFQRDSERRFVKLANPHEKSYSERRIFIASSENKRSRKLLPELSVYSTAKTQTYPFSEKALSSVFEACGPGAATTKQIPPWVMNLPAHELSALYRGLTASNGNANGQLYSTASKTLAFQFVELCAKLGMMAQIRWRKPGTTVYGGKSTGSYEIGISSGIKSITLRKRNFAKVRYNGKVWCPSVPPLENILVERNGKFTFCGNTKYGDGGVDMLPIADLYKTEVRKLGEILGVKRRIVRKKSSPRLWPGQLAESDIGLSYDLIDNAFRLYFDQGLDVKTVATRLKLKQKEVENLVLRYNASSHKRQMPEICKVR